jgi:hypothetical protein
MGGGAQEFVGGLQDRDEGAFKWAESKVKVVGIVEMLKIVIVELWVRIVLMPSIYLLVLRDCYSLRLQKSTWSNT